MPPIQDNPLPATGPSNTTNQNNVQGNNNISPFQELPNGVFSRILTFAINGNPALCLCSFQLINKHWNDFVQGDASEAWNFVSKHKFSGLFKFNARTRKDYLSLLRETQDAAWIIKQAMCRFHVAKEKLDFFHYLATTDGFRKY